MFHIVQLTLLPAMTQEAIDIPAGRGRTYLSIGGLQGHGVRRGVKYAVVVSPQLYRKEQHDEVRRELAAVNRRMRDRGDEYLVIVPGRLGSQNRDWGIAVEYKDVEHAAAIFEYGVDICGRAEPLPEDGSLTGGIYGSHFLYIRHYEEDQRGCRRMAPGTHLHEYHEQPHRLRVHLPAALRWIRLLVPDSSAPLRSPSPRRSPHADSLISAASFWVRTNERGALPFVSNLHGRELKYRS
jgi:hypothetical protein